MNKIERQRVHFEKRADQYYEKRITQNHIYLKKLIWREFFKGKNYLNKKNMMVLEPMCGYGDGRHILEDNLKEPFEYAAFDYSPTLVEKAKALYPDMNIWVMDVTKFSEKNRYDIVIIIGSLHHVPDYCERVIKNIYQSLKPGGYFINFEPTQNNSLFRFIRRVIYRRNANFDEKTERAFDLDELNGYYRKAGFEIQDQIYQGLSAFILYYNPNAFPFLNIGGRKTVKFLFSLDRLFFRNIIGKKLSFSTTTLLKK